MAGEKSLSIKAKRFCKYYVEWHANATDAYLKAYGISSRDSARKGGSRLLKNPKITDTINNIMEESGFNHVAVDIELLKLIKQDENKSLKLNAIKEYNRLDRRGVDKRDKETPVLDIDVSKMSDQEINARLEEIRRKRLAR